MTTDSQVGYIPLAVHIGQPGIPNTTDKSPFSSRHNYDIIFFLINTYCSGRCKKKRKNNLHGLTVSCFVNLNNKTGVLLSCLGVGG